MIRVCVQEFTIYLTKSILPFFHCKCRVMVTLDCLAVRWGYMTKFSSMGWEWKWFISFRLVPASPSCQLEPRYDCDLAWSCKQYPGEAVPNKALCHSGEVLYLSCPMQTPLGTLTIKYLNVANMTVALHFFLSFELK